MGADGTAELVDGTKIGGDWFSDPQSTCRKHGSKSNARKAASAMIAKIPLALAQHIAAVYYPRTWRHMFLGWPTPQANPDARSRRVPSHIWIAYYRSS